MLVLTHSWNPTLVQLLGAGLGRSELLVVRPRLSQNIMYRYSLKFWRLLFIASNHAQNLEGVGD